MHVRWTKLPLAHSPGVDIIGYSLADTGQRDEQWPMKAHLTVQVERRILLQRLADRLSTQAFWVHPQILVMPIHTKQPYLIEPTALSVIWALMTRVSIVEVALPMDGWLNAGLDERWFIDRLEANERHHQITLHWTPYATSTHPYRGSTRYSHE